MKREGQVLWTIQSHSKYPSYKLRDSRTTPIAQTLIQAMILGKESIDPHRYVRSGSHSAQPMPYDFLVPSLCQINKTFQHITVSGVYDVWRRQSTISTNNILIKFSQNGLLKLEAIGSNNINQLLLKCRISRNIPSLFVRNRKRLMTAISTVESLLNATKYDSYQDDVFANHSH